MNILAINDTKSSSDFQTRESVVHAIVDLKRPYKKTCRYYHVSRRSASRWVNKYKKNPCVEALKLGSHKPKTPHPSTYSEDYIQIVINKHRRCPNKTKFQIWCELQASNSEFKPCYMTVVRIFRRQNIDIAYKTNKKKKHNGIYETPEFPGIKLQADVKYIPSECNATGTSQRFYQYTILDEYSRKRFLYFTNEHSMYETEKAFRSAIKFFKFIPKEIQTDNGFEFTDKAVKRAENPKKSKLEMFFDDHGIRHHLIKPRTPQHNGKVERSHRIDQEQFYKYLRFYSLEDLREQGRNWMYKYNKTPRFILNFKSPNEKEAEGFAKLGKINTSGVK